MNLEEKKLLKDILDNMGGIALDRMLEDCEKLIETYNAVYMGDFLELQSPAEKEVEQEKNDRVGKKRKRKVRKGVGKE